LRRHDLSKRANMTAKDRRNEVAAILTRGLCRLRPVRQDDPQNSREKPLTGPPKNGLL